MKNKEPPVLQDLYRDVRRYNETKMKTTLTMVFAVFLIVGLLGMSSAANLTEEEKSLVQENMTSALELPEPGSDTAIENSWDKLRLAFTFNKEKKVEKALSIAEERLAEAEANAESNPERAEIAAQRYEHFAEKAEETMKEIEENTEEDANESFGEIMRIQNRFELHKQKAIMAHSNALEKMSQGNMSEEQREKIKGIFSEFENRSSEMQQEMQQKRENMETKLKVRKGMTDGELEEFIGNVEKRQGLEKARQRISERGDSLEKQRQRIQENLGERIAPSINFSGEQKDDFRENIENTGRTENNVRDM